MTMTTTISTNYNTLTRSGAVSRFRFSRLRSAASKEFTLHLSLYIASFLPHRHPTILVQRLRGRLARPHHPDHPTTRSISRGPTSTSARNQSSLPPPPTSSFVPSQPI